MTLYTLFLGNLMAFAFFNRCESTVTLQTSSVQHDCGGTAILSCLVDPLADVTWRESSTVLRDCFTDGTCDFPDSSPYSFNLNSSAKTYQLAISPLSYSSFNNVIFTCTASSERGTYTLQVDVPLKNVTLSESQAGSIVQLVATTSCVKDSATINFSWTCVRFDNRNYIDCGTYLTNTSDSVNNTPCSSGGDCSGSDITQKIQTLTFSNYTSGGGIPVLLVVSIQGNTNINATSTATYYIQSTTSTTVPSYTSSTAQNLEKKSSTGLSTEVKVTIGLACLFSVTIIIITVSCCLGICNPVLMKLGCKGLVKKNPKFCNAEVDNAGRTESAEAFPLPDKTQNGNTYGNDGRVDNGSIASSSHVHTTHGGTNIETVSDDNSPKRADDHAARQTLPRDQTSLPPIKSLEKANKQNKDKSRNNRGLSANFDSGEGLPPYETHTTASTTTYMIQMEKDDTEAHSETTTQHYPRNLPPIPDSDRSPTDAINDASDSSVSHRKLPQPPELDNTESNASHKTKKRKKKNRKSKEEEDIE